MLKGLRKMDISSWNLWINSVETKNKNEIDTEIEDAKNDDELDFVEKNLKLGYLYYKKDWLGTATSFFSKVRNKISDEKNNYEFFKENENGIRILKMGYGVQGDGCGGFEIVESSCCGDFCGPFCACFGIVTVMACCGIDVDSTCDCMEKGLGCCFKPIENCRGC